MQPVASNDHAVNLSASAPCDADRALLPTTPQTTLTSSNDADAGTAVTATADVDVDSLNSLEKGGSPVRSGLPSSESLHDATVPSTIKKPFLYWLRTSKHFITITILLALFTDMVTYGIIIPIMPSIIADMHGDSTLTGVLVAVYAAGIMSASPIFGVLSDKMASRRLPMMIGLSGMLIATIIFMFAKVYWLLVIARFFQGVSGGAVWTLGLALMTDSFPANEMGVQMGKSLIGHTMGLLGGPPIGGLLHDAFGARAPFYFCIAFAALVIFLLSILIEVRADEVLEIRRYECEIRERDIANGIPVEEARHTSLWKLITTKRMIAAVAVTTLEAFDLSSLEPTLPYYLRDRFSMTEGQIGLVFIAFTMPTICSPLAGWFSDRYGAKYLCSSAVFICGCFMLILSIEGKPLWAIILTLIGIGLSTSSFIAPILGEISAVVRHTGDKAAFARAFAIFNIAFSFGMLIGPILAGVIYQRHGFRWNCITTACVLFSFVPMMLLWMGDRNAKMEDVAMYEREMEEHKRMLQEIEIIKAEKKAAEELNANTLV
ncbi:major facilitator superfamily domain-containing protein [Gamsiella multidivaricata]|uniref:major facilitator superfamily domain-containing protein n=1 Tax=Gamsiella multidivaricata TaxID=101098 RepID=UPI00221FA25C|nr:major facilitator superfamily domain-containing protein [Gamsiella multidivaricata]KAG0360979.1 hypothetical protein BGZ54_009284 [Gamsiella multidivaricata]KAI7820158.1 major facilitator superfamily domain-containing protein [Gamsiella multidivaricata]